MYSYDEFVASVKNIGLKNALYFASLFGLKLAQAQIWVIRMYKGLSAENHQIVNDVLEGRG